MDLISAERKINASTFIRREITKGKLHEKDISSEKVKSEKISVKVAVIMSQITTAT